MPCPLPGRVMQSTIPKGAILNRYTALGIPVTQPVG